VTSEKIIQITARHQHYFYKNMNHANQRTPELVIVILLALICFFANEAECIASYGKGQTKYNGGAGVGRLVIDEKAGKAEAWECHYDMVLVERIQGKPKTDSGLFVPQEDLPKLHLCRVLSVGPGREEENGRISPNMPQLNINDIVIAKNPWGIGPKDEETIDGKKLSFMRSQDIAAVITGGIIDE
jgi:chaperonin GroES